MAIAAKADPEPKKGAAIEEEKMHEQMDKLADLDSEYMKLIEAQRDLNINDADPRD